MGWLLLLCEFLNRFLALWESVGLWFGWEWHRCGLGWVVANLFGTTSSVWDNKAMSLVKRFKAFTFRWKNATRQQIVFANILLYSCKVFQRKIEFSQDLHHAFSFSLQNPFRDVRWPRNPLRQDMGIAWNRKVILTLPLWRSGKKRSYLELGGSFNLTLSDCGCLKTLWNERWSMICSHMHVMSYISICPCSPYAPKCLHLVSWSWSDQICSLDVHWGLS